MRQDQRDAVFPEIGAGEGLSWSWHLDLETLLVALSEPAPWNRRPRSPVPCPSGPAPSLSSDLIGSNLKTARPSHDLADSGPDLADPNPDLAGPDPGLAGPDPELAGPDRAVAARPSETVPSDAGLSDAELPSTRTSEAGSDNIAAGDAELGSAESADLEPASTTSTAASADPVEAEFAEYLDAVDSGRSSVVPLSVAAGRVAEVLPASPDLAAWLACNPAGGLEDGALAGAASAYRRLASWAQAGELAVVAQMASRSAACDKATEVGGDGRPGKVPADAYGQVSLALTLSQAGAEWWTNLAVDLQWRLPATGQALRDGTIDLARAKAIAEATAALDDAKARAVEDRVLPRAGDQTTSQLRASLRRAVITADPEGAERRREAAERRAKVVLYPDAEGTASLSGQNLPGIRAAAAFARITALARALKAAGVDGGIDLLRSKVLLGLLLGTLPYIPPPPDGPPDTDGPPDPGGPPDTDGPDGTDGQPNPGGPSDTNGPSTTGGPPGARSASGQTSGPNDEISPHLDDWPWNNNPVPGARETPPGHDSSDQRHPPCQDSATDSGSRTRTDAIEQDPYTDTEPMAGEGSWTDENWPTGDDRTDHDQPNDERPDHDQPSDELPGNEWLGPDQPDHEPSVADPDELGCDDSGDGAMPWPEATPIVPPGPTALKNLQPVGSGFLDLRLPWLTLIHGGREPGYLTRLGPITPAQACYLALLAASDPAVEWRIVITDSSGRAIGVTRVRPGRVRAGPGSGQPRQVQQPAASRHRHPQRR